MTKENDDIETLAASGDRKQLDLLIGDVVNEIGSLHPEVTASNFAKARSLENLSHNDIAASETTAHLVTLQRRLYTTNPIYTACLAYPIYI